MFIYGLKNCDSCRKAINSLPNAVFIDTRATPMSIDKLEAFLAAFPDTLVNRRSTTWRNLSEEARTGNPIDLISEHPALMKRPVIEVDGKFLLGWTAEVRVALGVS